MKKKPNRLMKRFDLPKVMERKDYSDVCTMDDDHDEHCWGCVCFVFPIGCMKNDVTPDKKGE